MAGDSGGGSRAGSGPKRRRLSSVGVMEESWRCSLDLERTLDDLHHPLDSLGELCGRIGCLGTLRTHSCCGFVGLLGRRCACDEQLAEMHLCQTTDVQVLTGSKPPPPPQAHPRPSNIATWKPCLGTSMNSSFVHRIEPTARRLRRTTIPPSGGSSPPMTTTVPSTSSAAPAPLVSRGRSGRRNHVLTA